jgi:hypothetical protein
LPWSLGSRTKKLIGVRKLRRVWAPPAWNEACTRHEGWAPGHIEIYERGSKRMPYGGESLSYARPLM